MEDYERIFTYLESGIYPAELLKNEKRNFRRKCKENYKVENGQLHYRRSSRSRCTTQEEWKLCIKNTEDKERILKSCHSSSTGNYYTRRLNSLLVTGYTFLSCRRTLWSWQDHRKICSRVYWGRNMHAEIADYIKRCDVCQRVNDRFDKPPHHLHPIPVSPEVWKQVRAWHGAKMLLWHVSMHVSVL